MAEHLGSKFGIVIKKEKMPDDTMPPCDNNIAEAKNLIGQALNDITAMAHSGFESWQQSSMPVKA